MKTSIRHQKGQATAELCIALWGLVFMFIAVLYIGGTGIDSIRTLLDARQKAEELGSRTREGSLSGKSIRKWEYTGFGTFEDRDLTIPFLAGDRAVYGAGSFSNDFFSSQEYSYIPESETENSYKFIPLSDEKDISYTPRLTASSAFDIANPVFAKGRGQNTVTTFSKTENIRDTRRNLKRQGIFDIAPADPDSWPGNTVAFPAFAGDSRDIDDDTLSYVREQIAPGM